MHNYIIGSFYDSRFPSFFCVLCFTEVKLSVKVKLFVPLLCVCTILPAKAVPEMTYTVLGGTLDPSHSLTHLMASCVRNICTQNYQNLVIGFLFKFQSKMSGMFLGHSVHLHSFHVSTHILFCSVYTGYIVAFAARHLRKHMFL